MGRAKKLTTTTTTKPKPIGSFAGFGTKKPIGSFASSARGKDAGVKKKRHGVKDDVPIESLGLSDEESAAKEDADARVLKTFDLTSKYGPCCGMTRLERYDRAAGLGLDPPKKVLEVIQRRGVDDPRWRECVWFTLV